MVDELRYSNHHTNKLVNLCMWIVCSSGQLVIQTTLNLLVLLLGT